MTSSQTAATPELRASTEESRPLGPVTSSWLQRRLRASIVFYQRAREGRPSPCRFFPSCSAYALESIEVHGTWRGGWLSARRLVRCRPLGPSGFDPVPERRADSSELRAASSEFHSVCSDMSNHDTSCSSHSPAPKGS